MPEVVGHMVSLPHRESAQRRFQSFAAFTRDDVETRSFAFWECQIAASPVWEGQR